MCARGLSQLHQPLLLRQHRCIRVEWHRPKDELEGTVLLAFVQCGWQEQIVLPGIEGIGSGELRVTVASNKKEFCLVTGGYWALESTERRRYTTFCCLCQ